MLFDEIFNDFFNDFNLFNQAYQTKEVVKCPTCGRSYADFKRLGKLGCKDCYMTFRSSVSGVLKQIHSTSNHTGKIPSKSGEKIREKRRLEDLKKQLQESVNKEDYETAAKLHKQIRELENGGV